MTRIFFKLVLLFVLLIGSAALHAQGCAACKTNAGQAAPDAQRGLRRGIAVLLIPSLIIFSGVVFLAYKHRHAAGE